MLGTVLGMLSDPAFWLAAGQIIVIDILLGGDNAILIALACKNLAPEQRKLGIIWGTIGAIVLRIILIIFALQLLTMPYVKIAGGILLFWIGLKLMLDNSDSHDEVNASDKLMAAIRTIIVADLVMSVDNVLGIAGAAHTSKQEYQMTLIVLGLLVSMPLIVWGSQFVIKAMERFPIIITLGAGLLGYLAGGMLVTDPILASWFKDNMPNPSLIMGGVCAVIVMAVGYVLSKHNRNQAT